MRGARAMRHLGTCCVLLVLVRSWLCLADLFTLGYLTGSKRRPGEHEYSRPGLSISGAITLAVEEINERLPLVGGHALQLLVAETYGEEAESIRQTAALWTLNISAYIGPQETCIHEARMAAAFNLPMISYFCARYETSDKTYFPTFARTRPPDMQISKSVASVLLTFGWKKVTFLYSSAKDYELHEIAETIVKTLELCGIQVIFRKTWEVTYHHGYLDNPFLQLVDGTYIDSRIYVILGQYYEHIGLMVTMQKKGLFDNGEYFVVGVDIEQYDEDNPGMYLRGLLKDETEDVTKSAFRSYIGVVGSPPRDIDNFTIHVNDYMEKPPFNFPNPLTHFGGMKRIRAEAAYLYDAVHLYARALNDTLIANENPYDGRTIFTYLKDRTYKSAMGFLVHIDDNGDAEGNYTLIARKHIPRTQGEFGLYPIGIFQRIENDSIPVLRLTSTIEWLNKGPPVDEPLCGFRGEKCITRSGEIVAGVAGGALLTLIVVLLVAYRNWKYEQDLDSLLWKIDFKDIQINEYTPTHTNGNKTRLIHSVIRTSQVSLSSNPDADFRYSTIFTQIGTHKGHIFAIKKVRKKSIDITRKMKKELKLMRDLRHDNLNSFIGACVEPPNICIVTEYCARGSLKDILENEEVKLDNMFIASLVGDILRGLIYLHESPIRSHGRLQSTNCLVDSRWVLKIADFGLHEFKAGAELDDDSPCTDSYWKYDSLLYRAPELLRDPQAPSCGTQKGDVYSFSVILYEIHCRHSPYGHMDMTSQEILKRVAEGNICGTPFRPQLELLENPFDFVRSCLKECWAENPDERPDFKSVRQKLRPLRKGMRPNIFDNMIAMMEKYANNLEALVDEKTMQLMEEKKKTDALLFEMLPRDLPVISIRHLAHSAPTATCNSPCTTAFDGTAGDIRLKSTLSTDETYVAEQLKRGNKVEAESFDSVTIYFSDIVGFTAMSAESTPLQIVDFLNDLYTCFDSIIENYDVYKVETIGDAYMVVSGLPIRNGNLHAGEIASMSLHLLDAIHKGTIRHRPHETLMLRIGIHSGPVCAGVVGLKMPRYCLFGDTVNTASRMESNGLRLGNDSLKILPKFWKRSKVPSLTHHLILYELGVRKLCSILPPHILCALKIHCSYHCQEILSKLGGYQLEERGLIKMKGKGEMKTYWLVGEDENRREARLQQRNKRLNSLRTAQMRPWGEKGLNGCVPGTRSSFRKPLIHSPTQESPKRLRFARDNSDKADFVMGEEGGSLVKGNSCPCMTDLPVISPIEGYMPGGGTKRGCSSASLYFQPNVNCRTLDVSLPVSFPPTEGAMFLDVPRFFGPAEFEPLLSPKFGHKQSFDNVVEALDFIDKETPV